MRYPVTRWNAGWLAVLGLTFALGLAGLSSTTSAQAPGAEDEVPAEETPAEDPGAETGTDPAADTATDDAATGEEKTGAGADDATVGTEEDPDVAEAPTVTPKVKKPTYKTLPIATDKKAGTEARKLVIDVLSGGVALDASRAAFAAYFDTYEFPEFTSPKNLVDLPARRKRFRQQYLLQAKSAPAHDLVNDLILKKMTEIANDNYHPFARYNAMLMIAELSANEATPSARGTPYPAAFKPLLTAVASSTTPDGPKVAALIGLTRFAEQKAIPADQRTAARDALAKLLAEKNPPKGRSIEGHDWLRRRAYETLALMGETGSAKPVVLRITERPRPPEIKREERVEGAEVLVPLPGGLWRKVPLLEDEEEMTRGGKSKSKSKSPSTKRGGLMDDEEEMEEDEEGLEEDEMGEERTLEDSFDEPTTPTKRRGKSPAEKAMEEEEEM